MRLTAGERILIPNAACEDDQSLYNEHEVYC